MSKECCGPDEPVEAKRSPVAISLGRPGAAPIATPATAPTAEPACDCCTPSAPGAMGHTVHDEQPVEDDFCCDPRTPRDEPLTWWRDRALQLPMAAGLFLVLGFAAGRWVGEQPALVLNALALLAGAWTFVPGALRRLARRRLGVGLLMTIAAVGAVLLGKVAEAAALAFLFSLAEALEDPRPGPGPVGPVRPAVAGAADRAGPPGRW